MNEKNKLSGKQSKFILIPYELITDTTINRFRVLIYSYLYLKTGLDNTLFFNTENIKQYAGKKIGISHDSYADKIIESFSLLRNKWFLFYDDEIEIKRYKEIVFERDKAFEYCSTHRFAILYLDELDTILSYQSNNNRFDNSVVLLVFLYLRANIPIRHNSYCNNPEAYNAYYNSIGDDLGISEKIVSKAVQALKTLRLIFVFERCPIKYLDKKSGCYKYKTPTYIFCNTYKRIKRDTDIYLAAEGDDYYLKEAYNKMKYLEKHKLL